MIKIALKVGTLLVVASSMSFASGYRIPEHSTASTAKSAAHVADMRNADSSYFNPAAMSILENRSQLESGLTYIHLPEVDYEGIGLSGAMESFSSKKENFLIPYFHYVSPEVDNFRFGLSLVAPAGLSKRWNATTPQTTAKEFSLRVIEINPTISYTINNDFSIGGGLRAIYSDGVVKSISPSKSGRILKGDTIEFGYNLALHYHPQDSAWKFGVTYRSNVDISEDGNAQLYANGTRLYDGGASVTVPIPASLVLAVSYDFDEKTTVEFALDRTYWSKYSELDFEYDDIVPAILIPSFDDPKPKNWKDVNAYRIGITHKWDEKLTLMGGFAIDKNPVPEATLGYELPDSDARLYSFGFDYKLNDQMNIGFAYLYDDKKSRRVTNDVTKAEPLGEFSDGGAHLVNISLGYKF